MRRKPTHTDLMTSRFIADVLRQGRELWLQTYAGQCEEVEWEWLRFCAALRLTPLGRVALKLASWLAKVHP